MTSIHDVPELQAVSKRVRRQIIEMTGAAKSGHPGGSLSAVEILVTLFYGCDAPRSGQPASGRIATGSSCRKGMRRRCFMR